MAVGGLSSIPPSPARGGGASSSSSRWNPSTIVQLISVLAIAILVAMATMVRQHAELNSNNSDSSRRPNDGIMPLSSTRGGGAASRSKRMARKISKLEKELKSLSNEYVEVTKEITQLQSSSEVNNAPVIVSPNHVPLKPWVADQLLSIEREEDFQQILEKLKRQEEEGLRHAAAQQTPLLEMGAPRDPKDRKPKQWWIRKEIFTDLISSSGGTDTTMGSIIPFDLSVNHLQRISRAAGSPNSQDDSSVAVSEEFLPVVLPHEIDLRWRSRARANSRPEDVVSTTAYRIVARRAASTAHSSEDGDGQSILWDSGKVITTDGLPDVVHCDNNDLKLTSGGVGAIIEWRVTAWDSANNPSTSTWTKFAIGPSQPDDWKGQWISHPIDIENWSETDAAAFWGNNKEGLQDTACRNWEKRSQLPIFRARLPALLEDGAAETDGEDEIVSALLVVSGLGSFRTSLDGVPLSSSGPLDPPLTDFAQRVSYRGYDVTPFLTGAGAEKSHVVGISMGSGWWDHRPIGGSFIRLFYFPHGAVTCIAQLYVTYKKSGLTKVLLPTGGESSGWQVAKGHLRESSLFTGEYIDLQSMATFNGWDTNQGWTKTLSTPMSQHSWVEPLVYESDTTLESWRLSLHMQSHARPMNAKLPIRPIHKLSPIGKLIPNEIPPVLPIERIEPDEVYGLGNGRWMFDFGKGFSGMVRFEDGLPEPIVPSEYPRGHTVSTLGPDESFITVVYGESIELTRGDINIVVVAGMGLHDGGPKHKSKPAGSAEDKGGPCYPKDHIEAGSLLQRDVYILPRNADGDQSTKGSFADARQSHHTTHAFRFAEICCTAEPPSGVHALAYRTAFNEWGDFSSSNIRINGGYELVKNAMNSNMLGVQSDCPHREKIQYGGDIIADSPASLHMYDMSAFYRKAVWDWGDQQWNNGAYAGTSHWLALNDYAGIGTGSGETVWASAPIVMTARHMQHYGDLKLLEETFENHMKWFNFLVTHFDKGLKKKGYEDDLKGYIREGSGLGDWLTFRGRDTWLTHQSFYMATARCIAYIATKLGKEEEIVTALQLSNSVKERIARLYLRDNGSFLPPEGPGSQLSPGPEMSLFSRVVPGDKRCTVLRRYFTRRGHTWPGSDENAFVREMSQATQQEMIESGEVTKRGSQWSMGWSQWHGFNEGIFAVRYALKTLSDNGFHNIALAKANGFGCGTFEYMLSHNATTHWESWWRSEDLYSHNHPMLGATAEWTVSAVAGVALHPMTTGGRQVLFWPRFPNSASTIDFAGATQGTRRGDFAIAWKFEGLPADQDMYDSATVQIHIRLFVPPDGQAVFRLPEYSNGEGVDSIIKYATQLPDINEIKTSSSEECEKRRKGKEGFNYNWEFDREAETWVKVYRKKAIGTPCMSFLFHSSLSSVSWSSPVNLAGDSDNGLEVELGPGLYDVMVDKWQLKPEIKGTKDWRIASIKDFYESEDIGPYCSDTDTFDWNIGDASYLI